MIYIKTVFPGIGVSIAKSRLSREQSINGLDVVFGYDIFDNTYYNHQMCPNVAHYLVLIFG